MAQLGLGTRCVQAGYSPKNGEPRQIPIIQSTTFKYESSAEMGRLFDLEASGYFYSRLQNPTNDAVAARIAALEGGVGEVEAVGLDEMQPRSRHHAGPPDVAGVGGNLGLEKHDVEHGVLSVASTGTALQTAAK